MRRHWQCEIRHGWKLTRAAISLSALLLGSVRSSSAMACAQPSTGSLTAAFDLASRGQLLAPYPRISAEAGISAVPASIVKAVAWVESGWRQFDATGRPLVSPDFGYGVMQITSGMAGAFGNPRGTTDAADQSQIASDATFNIAKGVSMLAEKFARAPRIGAGDPSVLENWYYALWAYNGWGWVNNPNNPRFNRRGTPTLDPMNFPYQERVLYLVAHPPRDAEGEPLWRPTNVALPPAKAIGHAPHALPEPAVTHREAPLAMDAVTISSNLPVLRAGEGADVSLQVINTGTQGWEAGTIRVGYHLLSAGAPVPSTPSPFSPGVLAFGQAAIPIDRNVLPGQSATVIVTLRAPSRAGTYRVVWDESQDGITWFSQNGSWPDIQHLHVVNPSASVTLTPTPRPTAASPHGSPLMYVADTSIPDGSVLAPIQRFDKAWLVFNSGPTSWSTAWRLVHVSGTAFGARTISVPLLPACRSGNILAHLKAPNAAGRYTGEWRLKDGHGHALGDPLTVKIVVKKGAAAATPTPVPTSTREAGPTPTATPVG